MKQQILLDTLSCTPPDVLYHYTTQAGLLGIVKHKNIWATHTQFLNDHREYLYAVEIVREEIDAIRKTTTDSQQKALLGDMAADIKGVESINVCVCSFSAEKDSLSQWRAYSGTTSGFSIGFHGKLLADMASTEQCNLAQCIYDPDKQRAFIRALVEEVLEENIQGIPWDDEHHIPRGGNLAANLHKYAPILKHTSFKEEQEWRIISRPLSCRRKGFEFRPGISMLIPYYQFPLESESVRFDLREVVVGPTPHSTQARASVSSFLESQHLGDVPVNNSLVPYRNW